MTVSAAFDFNSAEYYRALRATMRHNPARWIFPVLGIGMPAVAIWIFVMQDWARLSAVGVIVNGAPWILISAFYLSIPALTARVLALRALRDDPRVRGQQTRIV